MTNTCTFSPCRQYRYTLEHVIDPVLHTSAPRRIMWIGLNPSTADEQQLDPTLRRIRRFSADWGYTAFVMTNLFAFRATDPRVMKRAADPVGPQNDEQLMLTAKRCEVVMAAWGAHGTFQLRSSLVRKRMSEAGVRLSCLILTKGNHPKHPLYVAASTRRMPYPYLA